MKRNNSSVVAIAVSLLLFYWSGVSAQDSLFQQITAMVDSVSGENLYGHIDWLQQPGGHNSRVNYTPGIDSAANYIFNQFSLLPGLNSIERDTFFIGDAQSPFNTMPLVNVIATLTGKSEPENIYVLGAHMDASASNEVNWNTDWQTIAAPGADDNATGVSVLLEVARILSNPAINFQNKYTLKFVAFGAEEGSPVYPLYHHGSRRFAQKAHQNLEQIEGMISIDLIGYNENYDFLSIVSDSNSISFGQEFIRANNEFSIGLTMEGPPFVYAIYSDHLQFWTEGYKAILLVEHAPPWQNGPYYNINPVLHTSHDTLGLLNIQLIKKAVQLNLAAFASISSDLTDFPNDERFVPSDLSLAQNYPNPFNPSSKIKYELPKIGNRQSINVQLVVYDILGNAVAILVHEEKSPGIYEVEFDARGLTSGVYLYSLRAGDKIITKKMLFLK